MVNITKIRNFVSTVRKSSTAVKNTYSNGGDKFVSNVRKQSTAVKNTYSNGEYELVYTTGGKPVTLFDAFIESNSRPEIVKKFAQRIVEVVKGIKDDAPDVLKRVCAGLGKFEDRFKNVEKIRGKIPRAMNDLTMNDTVELLSSGKITNVIGDAYGARIIVNDLKDIPKLIERLIAEHKNGKLKIIRVENYRGNGINPYINGNTLRKLKELNAGENIVVNKIKKAGYTRTNIDILINNTRLEFQVGGKHTTRFGDVEHYLYDMRLKGTPNLSKLNDKQKKLFYEMKSKYLNMSKKAHNEYEEYLTRVWKTLKNAEEKNLPFPELPKPSGNIPEILSAKNLLDLETVH